MYKPDNVKLIISQMTLKQRTFSQMPITACLPIAVILIIFSSCSTRKTDPRVILKREYKKEILDGRSAMKTYFLTASAPGLSVSVSVNGEIVWSESLGYASKELHAPATPETKYRIGGTSQMFTAFLIARLQEQGKFSIHDSFYQYIPEYPKKQWDFTLYQLGVHTAGFPESNPDDLIKKSKSYSTLKEYVKGVSTDSLLYQPDTYFMMSDYGPSLLGILAEEITGKRFPALMKELVLDTLKLNETTIDYPLYLIENRAQPYYQNYIAQMMNAPAIDLGFCAPSQGFLSTADDLNKAGQAVLDTSFFGQEIHDLFFNRHKLKGGYELNIGFGWLVTKDEQERPLYAQVGSTIGGSSMLLVFPDQKLVVSACSNLSDDSARLPAQEIAEIFLKKIDPRERDLKKEVDNPDKHKKEPVAEEPKQVEKQ